MTVVETPFYHRPMEDQPHCEGCVWSKESSRRREGGVEEVCRMHKTSGGERQSI
jgi:hypothetical protein